MPHDLIELLPTGELNLHFHAGQWKALQSQRRFIGVVAGTQSGKTSFAPVWLWEEIRKRGSGDYGFIGPTFQLLHKKAIPEFRRFFEEILGLGEYLTSPVQHFRFSQAGVKRTFGRDIGKVVVYFGYAENPDSLESATYKGVVLDEAGQKAFKRESWEAIQRRVAIHRGRILIATTPYQTGGWLKTEIIDKAGDPEIDLIQFASTMNPSFPIEEYNRAQRSLPRWRFDLMYRGIISRPAGQIYDVFTDAHRVPRFTIPKQWKRYVGLDFGGVHTAAVFIAEDPKTGKRYIYREYLAGGRTAAEHAKALLDGEGVIPICVGGSKSEGQWRSEFRAGGLPVREPDQPLVEVGIDRVYGDIKSDLLYVFDDLPGLIGEFESYSRELDDAGEPTEEIRDKSTFHRLDAVRYIIGWLNRKGAKMQTSNVDLYAQQQVAAAPAQQRTDAEIEALLEAA
jgi:hypothetical protein